MIKTKIILGSSSKYRKMILSKAGYKFEVMNPDIDEKAIRSSDYRKLTLLIASAKAQALLSKIQEPRILITSDQVVSCHGELREKPEDEKEARRFLESYAKYPAETITSVVVINTANKKVAKNVDIAKVYFKKFPQELIKKFIKSGLAFECAGGFNISYFQEYIEKIEGEIDSIEGLPMKLVEKLIKEVL